MPITSGVISSSSETLKLSKAILFYKGAKESYVTINDAIEGEGGAMQLGVGVAATTESIGELATLLVDKISMGGYLPETVLSVGLSSVIWWCKPSSRRVWFKSPDSVLGSRSGETPHPGLVFCVSEKGWSVWAVKGNKRPTPSTKLYQAPYFNVWSSGQICVGNVLCPDSYSQEALSEWEDSFFNSYFVHSNVHAPQLLLNHKGGSHAFWKMLLDGNHKKFPETALVDRGTTLNDILKKKVN